MSSRFKNWSLRFPPELHPLVLGRGQVEALDFRHWFYIAEARGPTAQPTWRKQNFDIASLGVTKQ